MPGTIKQLIQNYLHKNVVQVSASMETVGNQEIDHQYIVVDPIEKLNVKKDSSFMLALAMQRRGIECYVFFEKDFAPIRLSGRIEIW